MAERHSVVVTDERYYSKSMESILNQAGADLLLAPCRKEDEVISKTSEAETIITTSAVFSKKVLESLHRCRFIIRCGIGVDNIDIKAATELRILVAYLPDWYVEDVSNHIVTLLLSSSRKIILIDRLVRDGKYTFEKIQPIRQLKNRVLGIVGFGKIGRCLLRKLKPFGLHILVYDPYVSTLPEEVERVDLFSLVHRSDFIILNCPLTEENKGMIGEQQFNWMKSGVYIINTARGGLIDENALVTALWEKKVAGAALDAISREPVTSNHPLLQFDNVSITPHIGWYSEESLEEVRMEAAEDVAKVLKGELPNHPVNPEVWISG